MYKYFFPLGFAALAFAPALAQSAAAASDGISDRASARPTRTTEPAAPLNLQSALTLALGANAELSAARQEVDAIDASILQAGARPNPEVAMLVEGARSDTRTSTLQLNQAIELGGKRAARIAAAERGRDAATADLNVKRADIRATVIAAFFDVLTAQERVRLANESVELAQRGTSVASRRVIAGKVSPVEETKARIAQANVRLELNQAKSDLANSRKRLAATWGNPLPRFEQADGQFDLLPEFPVLNEMNMRLANAPALARAQFEVERRDALAQLERRRRVPDVTISLGVKRSDEPGRNQAIVGLSVPLPLFDRNQGNVLETMRRADKARFELTAIQVRLDSDLAQAHERLNAARQDADLLHRDILPGSQDAYEAASKGFEFGKFGFLDVLDAQRTLLQAKSQYLRALSEAHRAAAEIERILGDASSGATIVPVATKF